MAFASRHRHVLDHRRAAAIRTRIVHRVLALSKSARSTNLPRSIFHALHYIDRRLGGDLGVSVQPGQGADQFDPGALWRAANSLAQRHDRHFSIDGAASGHRFAVEGLEGPSVAMLALIIFTTWVFVGYDITIFLAGLGNIPGELYDAAKVDGASGWTLFRNITFPLLSPTTFFLLLLTVIGTFKAFNHIWVMTQGGPGDATTTTSIFIFKQLFQLNRYGYSAALSFILFFIILILTVLQNRYAGSRVVYD